MRKLLPTVLLAAALLPARAQLFSPEAFSGAAFGAMIGSLVGAETHGHGCHSYTELSGEGAAIGAGIGLLVGALAGEANRRNAACREPCAYDPAPNVSFGSGYSDGGSSAYVYYSPNAYTAPGWYYQPSRPNYAVGGTLLGAASGALIGEGASGKPAEGAAIGAAAGLVLGGIAEHQARKQERYVAMQTAAEHQQSAPALMPQDAGLKPHDSRGAITSKPCATSTYTWTSRPQIADAPRVPDAPTF